MSDIQSLRRILRTSKTIAMVGLSANWYRPSFFAAKYLQDHGYRVIPVTPQYDEVLGEKCYPTLQDVPEPVDVRAMMALGNRLLMRRNTTIKAVVESASATVIGSVAPKP